MNAALLSSARHDWETPAGLFAAVDAEFRLELDVCALPHNAKLPRFLSPADEALAVAWAPARCWMNPPYGRALPRWVAKANAEALAGALVVCLVPARVETAWWYRWCAPAEVRVIRGRVRFTGAAEDAPFPSALVVMRPGLPAAARMTRYVELPRR